MSTTQQKLLKVLETIKGNGSYVTSNVKKFTHPGLQVDGVGELAFPLTVMQVQELIKVAHKAPFGKGMETITDTTVRSAWEINPEQLDFRNEEWAIFTNGIIEEVKKGLGLEEQEISASFYKLLIYEEGDFFLPHKDSEKEKGMFATLLISLPSVHSGGKLMIRFDGKEETVDFSSAASNYRIPYTAFFADCEHEVKPVTAGYRINLVYNLVQTSSAKKISGQKLSPKVDQLVKILQPLVKELDDNPKAILLGHQYTPTNFSLGQLKQHDRPRALALMQAAEQLGYFAKLGLVTCYKMGSLEDVDIDYGGYGRNRYRNYYKEENLEDGTMGEIYEEYIQIKNWGTDALPPLGEFNLDIDDLITNIEVAEGDPTEKEAEGYTGNAGMTLEYWYHYGAVILWPKDKHFEMLLKTSTGVKMKWLNFYLENWEDADLNAQNYTRQLVRGFSASELEPPKYSIYGTTNTTDYQPLAVALSRINDEAFLKENGKTILVPAFKAIPVQDWVALIGSYDIAIFEPVFEEAVAMKDNKILQHLLEILIELQESDATQLKELALSQIKKLPTYLEQITLPILNVSVYYSADDKLKHTEKIITIIEKILLLSVHQESDKAWVEKMLTSLTNPLPRDYVNQVLVPAVQNKKYKDRVLTNKLQAICLQDLIARTEVEPTPPTTWTRALPASLSQNTIDLLKDFMASPTEQVFDYRKSEKYRKTVRSNIKYCKDKVDLRMTTIKKGSPHTLRLTKTQAAFGVRHQQWKTDVALLKKIKKK